MANHKGKPEGASERLPPSWGGPLNENDYAALAASWISREIADEAMLRRVDAEQGRQVVGQKGNRDCSAILIPNYLPGQIGPRAYRLRRDNPDWKVGSDGKLKPDKKYLGAPGSANLLYIPVGVKPEHLFDLSLAVVLVEGEKKSLALWRLAQWETNTLRFLPIALPGVWNWLGVIGKTGGPTGGRIDIRGPIPDLSRIEWKNRTVYIVFDANVNTNESVQWARKGIARELASRGANVQLVNLPADCGVNGVDDLLAAWGPVRVLDLFHNSVSGPRFEVAQSPQFRSTPDGMFRIVRSKSDEPLETRLTNFGAAVTANVQLNDGAEITREFEIEAELLGRRHRITIPAAEFARMDWPLERMGPAAIVFANQREHARNAIQSFSLMAEERVVYTHTGWVNDNDRWLYLHNAGAIGTVGAVSGVNVRLSGLLSRYELKLPTDSKALATAVKSSLKLVDLGPPAISFPLLAATYRSPLGETDFAVHLAGATGVYKSELAALHQQHFGASMTRLNLPGGWSSTGNALEVCSFHAKDALFVIDDFAPQGSTTDLARYHAAADRVFRAAGNHAGRSRLDSTAKLRNPKPPRATILSSGEDIPRNQSVRARLLILELFKKNINVALLTECQQDAREGRYAEAMGGFVQWLAAEHEQKLNWFAEEVAECRTRIFRNAIHARTPDIFANLEAAFKLFLSFALECGAIDQAERDGLRYCCWDALLLAAAEQGKYQLETEPAERFVTILHSLLASGRVHLKARDGGRPNQSAESCGWRTDHSGSWSPQGDCVGWAEDDDIYLEPSEAFRAVQLALRDIGHALPVSESTLRKRLHEKGFLASVDPKRETLTIRRSISGMSKAVLHFRRDSVLPAVSDADEDAE